MELKIRILLYYFDDVININDLNLDNILIDENHIKVI